MAIKYDYQEGNKEYNLFIEKFKPKKTTDDCYTPPPVYEAVADWVAEEYGLDRKNFVRPFYPGGDYRAVEYKKDDVVVDNPPFSILAEIIKFYSEQKIKCFLFAPTLTLFSGSSKDFCYLPCGVRILYENGALVNTSFITNIEPCELQARTVPELYRRVQAANTAQIKRRTNPPQPKYAYPDEVITAASMYQLSKYGVDFKFYKNNCYFIRALDAQRPYKKAIFGSGFLLSEKAAAEKAAAEKAAAERAAAEKAADESAQPGEDLSTTWELSERERELVQQLGKQNNK